MVKAELRTLGWAESAQPQSGKVSVARIGNHGATPPHDHLFHEIVFIEAGAADHLTVQGTRLLRPGDIILIRPWQWHGYQNPQQLKVLNCLIDRRLMNQLAVIMHQDERAFQLFTRPLPRPRESPPLVLHAAPAEGRHCLALLERIMAETRCRLAGWEPMATGALLEFLAMVVRFDARIRLVENLDIADRAQKAVFDTAVWLEQNAVAKPSLEELARRVALSPTHLSHVFSQRMGMGIVAYRNRIRIEEACRLLAHTDWSITEVAARLGYDEIAFFSRMFHQLTGQSPRQYRQLRNHPAGTQLPAVKP